MKTKLAVVVSLLTLVVLMIYVNMSQKEEATKTINQVAEITQMSPTEVCLNTKVLKIFKLHSTCLLVK